MITFTAAVQTFIFKLMANHSTKYQRGLFTPSVFDSLFSYTWYNKGFLKYNYGHECIPNNWYR